MSLNFCPLSEQALENKDAPWNQNPLKTYPTKRDFEIIMNGFRHRESPLIIASKTRIHPNSILTYMRWYIEELIEQNNTIDEIIEKTGAYRFVVECHIRAFARGVRCHSPTYSENTTSYICDAKDAYDC